MGFTKFIGVRQNMISDKGEGGLSNFWFFLTRGGKPISDFRLTRGGVEVDREFIYIQFRFRALNFGSRPISNAESRWEISISAIESFWRAAGADFGIPEVLELTFYLFIDEPSATPTRELCKSKRQC